jgi:hypothetical protein
VRERNSYPPAIVEHKKYRHTQALPNIHSTLQNRLKITFPERELDGKAQ